MFTAQVPVGPSKQLKRIIHTEHNIVKNPNWLEANELAIYKRGRGFELRATVKQIQVVSGRDSSPGGPDCESDALTTRPRRLQR